MKRSLVVPIESDDIQSFILNYLKMTQLIHGLTPKDIKMCSDLIFRYYNLALSNREIDFMTKKFRNEFRTHFDMSQNTMYVFLSRIRSAKILIGERVNPMYFPFDKNMNPLEADICFRVLFNNGQKNN